METDEEIAEAKEGMDNAEEALLALGFPKEHWEQIRSYITFAILHGHWLIAKGMEDKTKPPIVS